MVLISVGLGHERGAVAFPSPNSAPAEAAIDAFSERQLAASARSRSGTGSGRPVQQPQLLHDALHVTPISIFSAGLQNAVNIVEAYDLHCTFGYGYVSLLHHYKQHFHQ